MSDRYGEIISKVARLEAISFDDPWSEEMLSETFSYEYNHLIILSDGETFSYRGKEEAGADEKPKEIVPDNIYGYVIYSETMDEAELQRIAVSPEKRGEGYGNLLIKEMLRELGTFMIRRVMLEVRAGNAPAIGLYLKNGFKRIAVRKAYYRNPVEDAVIMESVI